MSSGLRPETGAWSAYRCEGVPAIAALAWGRGAIATESTGFTDAAPSTEYSKELGQGARNQQYIIYDFPLNICLTRPHI